MRQNLPAPAPKAANPPQQSVAADRMEFLSNPQGSKQTQSTKFKHFSRTFQGPKLHFSSTKIIDKKPYPKRGHSKFRLQCDTEVYCTVPTNTVMIKAKFQNLQDLNSRTFQGFSSTFKHPICFQGLEVFIPNSSIFKDFSSTQ